MVRIQGNEIDLSHVDISIMPSLECNLTCNMCMYDCSPNSKITLDIEKYKTFHQTIDWKKVTAFGFYGGEPSINTPLYDQFVNLVPQNIIKFIISNGSWSSYVESTKKFLNFCKINNLRLMVSGTPEHLKHQDRLFLEKIYKSNIIQMKLKDDDKIHPMGRARNIIKNHKCTNKCLWQKQPIRFAIFPTGHIIFQNCDGVYPVIGHITRNTFENAFKHAIYIRKHTCKHLNQNINEIIDTISKAKT
jgi:hypothetical protein